MTDEVVVKSPANRDSLGKVITYHQKTSGGVLQSIKRLQCSILKQATEIFLYPFSK
jgi:hypothetical protein